MLKKLWCNMMVADVNKAIEFYADVLGFQHVMSVPMGSEEVLFQHDRNKVLVYAPELFESLCAKLYSAFIISKENSPVK